MGGICFAVPLWGQVWVGAGADLHGACEVTCPLNSSTFYFIKFGDRQKRGGLGKTTHTSFSKAEPQRKNLEANILKTSTAWLDVDICRH